MTTEEEEYRKFQTPTEFERRAELMRKGIENAKLNSERKRRIIEASAWKRRRTAVAKKYDQ